MSYHIICTHTDARTPSEFSNTFPISLASLPIFIYICISMYVHALSLSKLNSQISISFYDVNCPSPRFPLQQRDANHGTHENWIVWVFFLSGQIFLPRWSTALQINWSSPRHRSRPLPPGEPEPSEGVLGRASLAGLAFCFFGTYCHVGCYVLHTHGFLGDCLSSYAVSVKS